MSKQNISINKVVLSSFEPFKNLFAKLFLLAMTEAVFTTGFSYWRLGSIIAGPIIQAIIMVYAIYFIAKELFNKDVEIGLKKIAGFLLLYLIVYATILLGFVFLIVPGIIMILFFTYAYTFYLIGEFGILESISKSFRLVWENFLTTLKMYFVGFSLLVFVFMVTFIFNKIVESQDIKYLTRFITFLLGSVFTMYFNIVILKVYGLLSPVTYKDSKKDSN